VKYLSAFGGGVGGYIRPWVWSLKKKKEKKRVAVYVRVDFGLLFLSCPSVLTPVPCHFILFYPSFECTMLDKLKSYKLYKVGFVFFFNFCCFFLRLYFNYNISPLPFLPQSLPIYLPLAALLHSHGLFAYHLLLHACVCVCVCVYTHISKYSLSSPYVTYLHVFRADCVALDHQSVCSWWRGRSPAPGFT
jgi:hypothetical protein